MPLRHGDFVLDADVTEGLDIEFGCGDPAETLAKRVIRVHHVPMASSVGYGNGALGPVVVPLRHLNKGQDGKKNTENTNDKNSTSVISCRSILIRLLQTGWKVLLKYKIWHIAKK